LPLQVHLASRFTSRIGLHLHVTSATLSVCFNSDIPKHSFVMRSD